jgi:protein arginine kinase
VKTTYDALRGLPEWVCGEGQERDVVLSSRARLARNVSGYPFPHRATANERRLVVQAIRQAAKAEDLALQSFEMSTLTPRERDALVDSRRLSPDMLAGLPEQVALLDSGGVVSLLLHEEDHLRLQVILSGNAVKLASDQAQEIAARLATRLTFAHDPLRFGYLTTGLNNMGTGLRVSAQLHLPALAALGKLPTLLDIAYRMNGAVRGPVGEHSQAAAGDLVQISNAVSAGRDVDALTGAVTGAVRFLVDAEHEARDFAKTNVPETIQKTAVRYWNELALSDELTTDAALTRLSLFRLACLTGLAAGPDTQTFIELVALLDIRGQDDQRNRLRIRLSRLRSALRPYYAG